MAFAVTQFSDVNGHAGPGFMLENTAVHPLITATALPGFGAEHARAMQALPQLARAVVVLRDATRGRVEIDAEGRARYAYELTAGDLERLRQALRELARAYLAADAREVWLPVHGLAPIESESDLAQLDAAPLDPTRLRVPVRGAPVRRRRDGRAARGERLPPRWRALGRARALRDRRLGAAEQHRREPADHDLRQRAAHRLGVGGARSPRVSDAQRRQALAALAALDRRAFLRLAGLAAAAGVLPTGCGDVRRPARSTAGSPAALSHAAHLRRLHGRGRAHRRTRRRAADRGAAPRSRCARRGLPRERPERSRPPCARRCSCSSSACRRCSRSCAPSRALAGEAQDAILRELMASRFATKRLLFGGVRSLALLACYGDAASREWIDYPPASPRAGADIEAAHAMRRMPELRARNASVPAASGG